VATTIREIFSAVAEETGIPIDRLTGRSRKAPIAHARAIGVLLCRRHTKASSTAIGHFLEFRDHSSALHLEKRGGQLIAADPRHAATALAVERRLGLG
jgi:chromosomal replication initiator protein